MKITTAASLLAAALLPLAARAEIPLIDDLVQKESWSYVPVSAWDSRRRVAWGVSEGHTFFGVWGVLEDWRHKPSRSAATVPARLTPI
jgi:hypothetical protein